MAHNIDTMAYSGEVPWHGLGTKVDKVMTAEEAIIAGGLGWKVKKEPIYLKSGKMIADKFATVREDRGLPLGVVGDRYTVLNNKDAFSFLDAVVTEKDAIYHTVGSLGNGERIWLLAKLPKSVVVTHDDVVDQYLLLSNSHDGTSAVTVRFTPIRVVCQNTLIASFRESSHIVSIRHSGDMAGKVKEARRVLGISSKFYEQFGQMAQAMTKVSMNKDTVETFLAGLGLGKDDIESTRAKNVKAEVLEYAHTGKGNALPGVEGTLWAYLNGAVEYVDYGRKVRNVGDNIASNRLESVWFGSGAELKRKAWDTAVQMVGVN